MQVFFKEADIFKRRELLEKTSNLANEPAPQSPSPSPQIIIVIISGAVGLSLQYSMQTRECIFSLSSTFSWWEHLFSKNQPQDNKQSTFIVVAFFLLFANYNSHNILLPEKCCREHRPWTTGLGGKLHKVFVTDTKLISLWLCFTIITLFLPCYYSVLCKCRMQYGKVMQKTNQ